MLRGLSVLFVAGLFFIRLTPAFADWEVGTKVGFDSNVNQSTDQGQSDTFLAGYAAYFRVPTNETRYDWTFSAIVEGAAYARTTDLSYSGIVLEPGIVLIPHRTWTVSLSPFLQVKTVKDEDQSALAFGGKVNLEEQLRSDLYMGQYYIYTDSRADVDTFSFTEHAVGAYLGLEWTKGFRNRIGYEYSRGDSFRTVGTSSITATGHGKHRRFSTAFDEDVFRERVHRHSVSVSAGVDWNTRLFSQAGYTFTVTEGDLGSSNSHGGFLGLGYRF